MLFTKLQKNVFFLHNNQNTYIVAYCCIQQLLQSQRLTGQRDTLNRHNLLFYLILLNDLPQCWIRAFYLSISLPLLSHPCWPIEFSPAASWTAGLHSVWPLVFSDWPCAVQALTPEIQSLGWISLHPSNGDLTRPNKSHLVELNSGTRNREYRTWLAFQTL